ncbi:hypothetical protein [Streptomyces sp. NPDC001743]
MATYAQHIPVLSLRLAEPEAANAALCGPLGTFITTFLLPR